MRHSSRSPKQAAPKCVFTLRRLNQHWPKIYAFTKRELASKTLIRVFCPTADKQCIGHTCAVSPTSREQRMQCIPYAICRTVPERLRCSTITAGGVA